MECPVCMVKKEKYETFRCGHSICTKCSKMWFESHTTCPMCRDHVKLSKRSQSYLRRIKDLLRTRNEFQIENLLESVEHWKSVRQDEASKEFLRRVEELVYKYT